MKANNIFTLGVFACVTATHAGLLFLINSPSFIQNKSKPPAVIMEMVNFDIPSENQLTNIGQIKQETKQNFAPQATKIKQKLQAKPESQANTPVSVKEKPARIETKISQQTVQPKTQKTENPVTRTITDKPSDTLAAPNNQNTIPTDNKPTRTSASQKNTGNRPHTGHSDNGRTKESISSGKNDTGSGSGSTNNAQASGGGASSSASTASISRGQINSIEKKYPEDARLAGIEGTVHLSVVVGSNGRAKNVTVLGSSHRLLNNAAKLGAKNAKYIPALNAGKAVEGEVKFSIIYQLT